MSMVPVSSAASSLDVAGLAPISTETAATTTTTTMNTASGAASTSEIVLVSPSTAGSRSIDNGSIASSGVTSAGVASHPNLVTPPATSTTSIPANIKGIIGVCALDTKARSKPMRNILNRILAYGDFQAIVFGDKVILDEDIDHWPRCDFFISFFSTGFPLEKAIAYVEKYHPYCINDLHMQELLFDRRLVLAVLDAIGVPTPRRIATFSGTDVVPLRSCVIKRLADMGIGLDKFSKQNVSVRLVDADTIECVDEPGCVLRKPFVEKPVSGEDHNVYIYYHSGAPGGVYGGPGGAPNNTNINTTGVLSGGVRKLFRKVGNKSSEFHPDGNKIRTGASYVYEEFMSVDHSEDVKVYTIGENYAHAETRKSPVVDGIVRRNAEGKEIRYITPLTEEERDIARKVCRAFGQTVCGFDLLRAGGKSYVIDVNGWSFVKGNAEYYDNCARIVHDVFVHEAVRRGPAMMGRRQVSDVETQWRLKAYLSVLRHADRTPKQKVKFTFKSPLFLDLLNGAVEEIVLKRTEDLLRVAAVVRVAMEQGAEDPASLDQLARILDAKATLQGTKAQLKPGFSKTDGTLTKVQLIVKWGGVFTHGGLYQSRDLAENLRKDLDIINRDLLSDVQVYSSSEQRVTDTAEIFTKVLMEGNTTVTDSTNTAVNLTDINTLIQIDKEMLDDSNAAKEQMDQVKIRLQAILNPEDPAIVPPEFVLPDSCTTDLSPLVHDTIALLRLMRDVMRANTVGVVPGVSGGGVSGGGGSTALSTTPVPVSSLSVPVSNSSNVFGSALTTTTGSTSPTYFQSTISSIEAVQTRWCCSESAFLFVERWEKLFRDFVDVDRTQFEPSKISELYDSLKFDLLHNREFLFSVFDPPGAMAAHATAVLATSAASGSMSDHGGGRSDAGKSAGVDGTGGGSSSPTFSPPAISSSPPSQHYSRQPDTYTGGSAIIHRLYTLARELFHVIGPHEYGIANSEKLDIGFKNTQFLIQHLYRDLEAARDAPHPSTRLYFTKESKVICLLNLVLLCGLCTKVQPTDIQELDYLTQISFEVYERVGQVATTTSTTTMGNAGTTSGTYSLRIAFSPGAHDPNLVDLRLDRRHSLSVAPRRWISDHIDLGDALRCLDPRQWVA